MNPITVTIGNIVKEYESGTTYLTIANEFQCDYSAKIVLALVDNRLQELMKPLVKDCSIAFITLEDKVGHSAYRRGILLMMQKAILKVAGKDCVKQVRVHHSLDQGYYCTIDGKVTLDEAFLKQIKEQMLLYVKEDFPILKESISTNEAIELFRVLGMTDKEKLFRYRNWSSVNLYNLSEHRDYYYGYMVPSTGYLKYFDFELYNDGFVVLFPRRTNCTQVAPFCPSHKLATILEEAITWGDWLDASTVGELNDKIVDGSIRDLILVQEALQEQKLAAIAMEIKKQPEKKIIMIAGPSSSGKTTFSHRLSIQLLAQGLRPHPIPVDDYFVNRDKTPRDAFGEVNYECLEAIDVEQFNKDMTALLEGKRVELPSFNFKTGVREYKGKFKQLGKNDILVIEGIHCLNDKLSYSLTQSSKYKIYISALTQLNIDEHNCIPTTDGRLLRRMVRDARTRGASAQKTISMWDSVRRGEEENIFPYQDEADAMFNSALIYELAVLKQYAQPLLYDIEPDTKEFIEAKRLLKFLDYFLPLPNDGIAKNSILREFIGGSCFPV